MIRDVDEDGNGEIDFDEFVKLMVKKMAENQPEEELLEVFRDFDKNCDDLIDFHDLKSTMMELGEHLTDDDVHDMIDEHDHDNDKALNYPEFVKMMMAR
jgi:Ca2+-binding EF-hand superfamily protein